LFVILVASIALALENPLNDPDGELEATLFKIDIVTTSIFVLEVLFKVIAFGFLFNGPKSYLLDSWQIMDALIVVVSIVSLMPFDVKMSFLKVMRMIRLLRPLRVISKNENLKISIKALIVGVPAIASLSMIVLLVIYLFAIVSINILKGKSFYCNTDDIIGLSEL
jgi:hypothetical protein